MEQVSHYQVRGVPGSVTPTTFHGRRVDFWAPIGGSDRVIVAHDGQNIFDKRTATRGQTWELAQHSIAIAHEFGLTPPAVIGVFHSTSSEDPFGRAKDLAPQQPFQNGVKPVLGRSGFWQREQPSFPLDEIRTDAYLALIAEEILPAIEGATGSAFDPAKSAMLGSSMGGLATLYAMSKCAPLFQTALAFSPHWIIGERPLVESLMQPLNPELLPKLWMSRGTKGHDRNYEPFQDFANQIALDNGYKMGSSLQTRVFKRTGHNEKSWRGYLPQALRFWLNP